MAQLSKEAFFKRYDIDIREGRLGGGAFGTVYKTYDTLRDEWKAVKIAEVKYINDKEFSLITEFEAISSLPVHKNIANYESVHRIQMPNGLFDYAVMQYYHEGNFKQLQKNHQLNTEEKIEFLRGLFDGLKFLHDNNRMHRDLKPSNILISKRKGKYIPKIADFGLSKNVDSKDLDAITNSIGGGTLEYSSPEQLLGKSLRFNTDIWSVGIISFELFIGKIPFEITGSSSHSDARRVKIYQNIINAPIPPQIYDCPDSFQKIISSCLIKDPEKRCQNLHEFDVLLAEEGLVQEVKNDDDKTLIIGSEKEKTVEPISNKKKNSKKTKNPERRKTRIRITLMLTIPLLLMFLGVSYFFKDNETEKGFQLSESDIEQIISAKSSEDFVDILINNPGLQEMKFFKQKLQEVKAKEEEAYWENIKNSKNIKDFETYIIRYSEGNHLKDAKEIIQRQISFMALGDETMQWTHALKSESITAVNEYLKNFPNGKYLREANQLKKIWLNLEAEEKWTLALKENTIESFEKYILQNPSSPNIKNAKQKIELIQKQIKVDLEKRKKKKVFKNPIPQITKQKKKKETSNFNNIEDKEPIVIVEPKVEDEKLLSSDEWNKISTTTDINILEAFIISFPNSKEAIIAKINIANFKETNDFKLAINSDNLTQLKGFIKKYPNSKYNKKIKKRINELELKRRVIELTSTPVEKITAIPSYVLAVEKNMIKLLSGTYNMGCDVSAECGKDAYPSVEVRISVFMMSKFEVTQKEFKSLMGYNPSFFKDCDKCPVENINYFDALKYIKKLNNLSGNIYTYRLPTEAEWEYAAGGSRDNIYSGTNSIEEVGYYRSNSNRRTHRVGSKNFNSYKLFDMSGNVYEWCSTWYNKDYYTKGKKTIKVIRGGSWQSKSTQCKIKTRSKANPNDTSPTIGFRLVRSI